MLRSTSIPLLILAGLALTPPEVGAGPITYSIVDYSSITNPYTVSGSITTNGATGTNLPISDITGYDILVQSSTTHYEIKTQTSFILGTFDATATSLTVATGMDEIAITDGTSAVNLTWRNLPATISYLGIKGTSTGDQELWFGDLPTLQSPVATVSAVPEPSSAALASIGAVVAFLAYGWSRHRRAQRRLEAA
jgi:hypothetical protein